ncbi:MAG: hypothetical protein FWD06_07205 [Oscillospiraceae bacterium]|nr:hypothetical protein [Oscillospiraceae bacterium]
MQPQYNNDYFAMFESAAAPVRKPVHPHPNTKPRRDQQQRPDLRLVPQPKQSIKEQNAHARQTWKRFLTSATIIGIVGACAFGVIYMENRHHQVIVEHQQLQVELAREHERNLSFRTQIEQMFSLEIVQDIAINQLRMVPVQGGRVTYLNMQRGDQRLD